MLYSAVVTDLALQHLGESCGRSSMGPKSVRGSSSSQSARGAGRLGRGGMTVGSRPPIEYSSDAASGMSGESGNGILFILFCCRCERCKLDFGAKEGECF